MPFLLLSLAVFLFRHGNSIDRRARTFARWYGIGIPMIIKRWPLDENVRVLLSLEEGRGQKNNVYYFYQIALDGPSGRRIWSAHRDESDARATGEEVASFLNCPLMEALEGRLVTFQPGELGSSISRRISVGQEVIETVTKPSSSRILEIVDGEVVVFDLPPMGFRPAVLVAMLPPGIFVSYFMAAFFPHLATDVLGGKAHPLLLLVLIPFFVLPLAAALMPILTSILYRERLAISPGGIRIERSLLRTKNWTLPLEAIRDLSFAPMTAKTLERVAGDDAAMNASVPAASVFSVGTAKRGLLLATQNQVVSVGGHLSLLEIVWLKSRLLKIIQEATSAGRTK
ncbi:hypothetical protein HY256_05240 [Candidatus Sumerlaeota bacterium]|nr:hypothetical protein [Candidatus Sumerlaeota bacterium]